MEEERRLIRTLLVWIVVSLFTISAANPVIRITPNVVNVGLTKTLDMECTFQQGSVQSFASLFSLVLMHSQRSGEHLLFRHLVSASSTTGLVNGTILAPPFTTSGLINNRGSSYVKITWGYPKQDRAGLYKCEAHGHDVTGRPVSASSSSTLQAHSPGIDMVVSEIRGLKDYFDQLQIRLSNSENNLSGQIRTLSSSINQLQTQVSNSEYRLRSEIGRVNNSITSLQSSVANLDTRTSFVKSHQDNVKNSLVTAKQAMFTSSGYYQSRRYWITRSTSVYNPSYAQAACIMYGGYLAEINSYDEITFIQNFVRWNSGRFSQAVMLGGTDEGHEGTWIHMYSRTSVPSLWYRGQPDNYEGKEHCLCLWRRFDWAMNDAPCNINDVGFLCEIPE